MSTAPGRPRAGSGTGRFRNTLANNASKSTFPMPVVSPQSAVGYGSQMGALQQGLFESLAALQAKKAEVMGTAKMGRADVKAGRIAGAVSTEADALGRGMVGSSADLAARSGNVADAAKAAALVVQQKTSGLLGLQQERIGALNTYHTGVFDLLAQKQAEKAAMAQQAFLEDAVMRLGDEQSARADALRAKLAEARAATAAAKQAMAPNQYAGTAASAFTQPGSSPGGAFPDRFNGHTGRI
jgi:hypothetical protein